MKTVLTFLLYFVIILPVIAKTKDVQLQCVTESTIFSMAAQYKNGHFAPWSDYKGKWHYSVKDGYTLQHAIRDIGSLSIVHEMPRKKIIKLIKRGYAAEYSSLYVAENHVLNNCLKRHGLKPTVPEVDKKAYCQAVGTGYLVASSVRNHGGSPKQAFDSIRNSINTDALPDYDLKQLVNKVFFNPAFARAGGPALSVQMYHVCMGDYKPLE